MLKCLYKLSTSKIFEKFTSPTDNSEANDKEAQSEGSGTTNENSSPSMVDIDCYSVSMVELCVRSRTLLVAGTSHVIVYQFSTVEETLELVVSIRCQFTMAQLQLTALHCKCPTDTTQIACDTNASKCSPLSNILVMQITVGEKIKG